jgi:hypothetical protein
MWRMTGRHKNHFIQIKGGPYLFSNDEMTIVNRVKRASYQANALYVLL